uniref:Uncharacterized protein n=1 Tax=Solanum demissum TaxID=50514 RepID=Q6L3Q6_SOLDE|nr:hypothetical protein SDM1_41t00024 [Solanum demissum]
MGLFRHQKINLETYEQNYIQNYLRNRTDVKQGSNVQEVQTHNQQNNAKNKVIPELTPYTVIQSFAAKLRHNEDSNMDSRQKKGTKIRVIKEELNSRIYNLPNSPSPGAGKNHHADKSPAGKTQAKLGEDSVLPTPLPQNPPSMPNVLAGMDKARNTKAFEIKGIDSMLPLPLTPLDNCLTVVEVVGLLDGGLEENITNLQEEVSKGGFLHHDVHENLHTDPKKDPRNSATTSHHTT